MSTFDLRMFLVPDRPCVAWDHLRFALKFGPYRLKFPEESVATKSLTWLEADLGAIDRIRQQGMGCRGGFSASMSLELCPGLAPLVAKDDLWVDLTFEHLIASRSTIGLLFKSDGEPILLMVTPSGHLWSWKPDLIEIRKLYHSMHPNSFRELRHKSALLRRLMRRGVVIGRGGRRHSSSGVSC